MPTDENAHEKTEPEIQTAKKGDATDTSNLTRNQDMGSAWVYTATVGCWSAEVDIDA